MKAGLTAAINEFFELTYVPAEIDILIDGLNLYAQKAGYKLVPAVEDMYKDGSVANEIKAAFAMSILASKERMMAFLELPSEAALTNDPLMKLSADITTHLMFRSEELIKMTDDFSKSYR